MEASEGTAGAQPTGSSTRQPAPDERYHPCPAGWHWGPNGAAGVLPWTVTPDGRAWVLLSRRSPHVQAGGTWSTFGGAIDGGETPWHAAVRETSEEIDGIDVRLGVVAAELEVPCEHGCGWTYTTFAADEFRRPAHVCQMAGPGEAVARDIGDGRVQHRQRAVLGVLRQQPVHDRPHQIGRTARAIMMVDRRRDQPGMGRVGPHARPGGGQPARSFGAS